MSGNQKRDGHFRLYTFPKYKPNSGSDRYKRIIITSINDFSGKIKPKTREFINLRYNQNYQLHSGGINGLKAYLDIFKTKFKGEILTLDAGSFLDPRNADESFYFYKSLGIDYAILGRNEFAIRDDVKAEKLRTMIKETSTNFIASNIFDLQTLQKIKWENVHPGVIKQINGVKIGLVGLIDPKRALSFPSKNIAGLYFQNMGKVLIETSNELRKKGAQVIVAIVHGGLDCTSLYAEETKLPDRKVNFDPNITISCDTYKNSLAELLGQVPDNLVDLVVTGGIESKVANIFKGIPVMQNYGNGEYISWAEIYYDTKHQAVSKDMSYIHQPVQTCHEFMNETQDCYPELISKETELAEAIFLDQEVKIPALPEGLSLTH